MATAPVLETTALAPVNNAAAAVVLFDNAKFDAFYAKLKADVDAVPVDLSTKKGRDAIASVAAKVRSEKASIDKDRLRLTKEWRDMTSQVNGAWNTIKEQLDTLAVDARKPLTDWEEAEKARVDRCNDIIGDIMGAAVVTMDDTSETVRERGMKVWAIEIGPEFGPMAHDAEQAKSATVSTLQAALARLKKEEADKAELEALRAAAAERAAKEQAAQKAKEIEEAVAAEAQAKEAREKAAQKAEADRLENVRQAAAAKAQRETEQAAAAERQRVQREHEKALAAERAKAAEIERAAQVERDRAAAEQEAQAKREADQAHRSAVMKSAKEAIMTCGVDEETAKKVVLLIRTGEVPHIELRF